MADLIVYLWGRSLEETPAPASEVREQRGVGDRSLVCPHPCPMPLRSLLRRQLAAPNRGAGADSSAGVGPKETP